jgi:hypothetical protein
VIPVAYSLFDDLAMMVRARRGLAAQAPAVAD